MRNRILPGCEPVYLKGGRKGCLLLHGFTSSPYEMRLLGEALHQEGYTVHIPLLPGHGTSPAQLRRTNWYQWFDTAKKELFELRKHCSKVFIIGFSMGGAMALHLAAHYQIDGVVALAPGLHLRNKFAYLSGLLSPFFWYSWKKSGPDIKAQVKTHTYNIIPLKAINQLLLFLKHLENDLGDVYSPTLIIYASNDHVIHPESSREIYQKISSPSKRILELRESYHIITLDVEKEIAIQEVVKFIKDL